MGPDADRKRPRLIREFATLLLAHMHADRGECGGPDVDDHDCMAGVAGQDLGCDSWCGAAAILGALLVRVRQLRCKLAGRRDRFSACVVRRVLNSAASFWSNALPCA